MYTFIFKICYVHCMTKSTIELNSFLSVAISLQSVSLSVSPDLEFLKVMQRVIITWLYSSPADVMFCMSDKLLLYNQQLIFGGDDVSLSHPFLFSSSSPLILQTVSSPNYPKQHIYHDLFLGHITDQHISLTRLFTRGFCHFIPDSLASASNMRSASARMELKGLLSKPPRHTCRI